MVTKLDKNTLKGIRLDGQIIPSTTDNVQVQARYVQVTPDPTDLNNILGMSNVTGSVSGGCANNLYDVLTGMIPYTGARTNVDLGSHTITSGRITANGLVNSSSGFYLTNKSGASISSIDTNSGVYLLTNYGGGYNCLQLEKLYTEIAFTSGGSSGNSLVGHLNNLYDKVNHITRPLRFMGIITSKNSGNLPPTGAAAPEIGDVWHFNDDVVINGTQYYKGDEVVYVNMPGNAWEILGQSITPIPTDDITFKKLEETT